MAIINNYSLLKHNTFGLNVLCDKYFEYSCIEEIQKFIKEGNLSNTKFLHIGAGSNLLFLNNFNGIILHSTIKDISIIDQKEDDVYIRVGSGYLWDDFVKYCVENGFYGAENLSLIPGEVGASPVQNIGAYGSEAKDIICKVELIDVLSGEGVTIENKDCKFSYRQSIFKKEFKDKYFVHHVIFKLHKTNTINISYGQLKKTLEGQELTLSNVRTAIIKTRQTKLPDPLKIGSAGSFFMNPIIGNKNFGLLLKKYPQIPYYEIDKEHIKIPAGWLIEQCGWKGKHYKNAAVYDKQSLILVNYGNATGMEIKELSTNIQEDVFIKFNIKISTEVLFID